jgi:hypothetical protein
VVSPSVLAWVSGKAARKTKRGSDSSPPSTPVGVESQGR